MAASRPGAAAQSREPVVEAARELYGLPRERFVAERNARARELRQAGDREAAAAVKALAKPTVLAWSIDQAVRERPDDAESLMETIAAMQAASSADELRDLAQRHEALVHALARAADESAGGGKAADLAAAIRVAALSADAQRFVDGTLADTPRAGEDSLMAALAAGAAAPSRPRRPREQPSTDRNRHDGIAADDERAAARDARAERDRVRTRRRELRDAIKAAREASRVASRELRDLEREVDGLERELERARHRAAARSQARDDADARVVELQQELDELRD